MAKDILSGLGRYELIDEEKNHKKFWSVEQKGSAFEIRWGRIGTTGQGPQIVTASEASKRIAEKIKKGYILVSGYRVQSKTSDAKEAVIAVWDSAPKEIAKKAVQTKDGNKEDLLTLFNKLK